MRDTPIAWYRQSCLVYQNHLAGYRHSFQHSLFSPTQADPLAITQLGDDVETAIEMGSGRDKVPVTLDSRWRSIVASVWPLADDLSGLHCALDGAAIQSRQLDIGLSLYSCSFFWNGAHCR